jgi:cell division protein FtsW (lipid II flippase)
MSSDVIAMPCLNFDSLPFVSQGGSALMALMAAMGLVTNVSKSSKLD